MQSGIMFVNKLKILDLKEHTMAHRFLPTTAHIFGKYTKGGL